MGAITPASMFSAPLDATFNVIGHGAQCAIQTVSDPMCDSNSERPHATRTCYITPFVQHSASVQHGTAISLSFAMANPFPCCGSSIYCVCCYHEIVFPHLYLSYYSYRLRALDSQIHALPWQRIGPRSLGAVYFYTTFIRAITSLLQIRQVARLRSTTCNLQGLSPTQRSTQTTPSRDLTLGDMQTPRGKEES